jgi:hypothetical protein
VPSQEEKLWQARFAISEQQRREHLTNASLLVRTNATLESRMQEVRLSAKNIYWLHHCTVQTERDTVEVAAYLQREIAELKDELRATQDTVKEVSDKGTTAAVSHPSSSDTVPESSPTTM